MSRSTLLVSLFSLCLLAPVGCAANSSDDAENGESDAALTSSAQPMIGNYADAHAPSGAFASLVLQANGKYTAQVVSAGHVECFRAPCPTGPSLLSQNGAWNVTKSGTKLKLRLRATGEASRYFDAKQSGDDLVLTTSSQTQTLTALKACGGFAGLQCGGGEECVDDPSDSCDPAQGGRDCSGVCKPATLKACGGIGGLSCGENEECVLDAECHMADCMGTCQSTAASH